ncbi:C39 family peptidase [Rugamonas sp.]|uniref:C39 family peptidase n=1 Tax=Rugamonas sp. TaxID=1926287 RepID=UPI0025F501D3|nr:C39 family peptidase [Rugamonas sp.]
MKRAATSLMAALAVAVPARAIDLAGIAGGNFQLPLTSMKAARFQSTVHQQYDFSCGSAAVATLLRYHYDYPVEEKQVFEDMFLRGDQPRIRREGFSLLDIKLYLERHGFQADGFELPLSKLVAAGYPAIVLVSDNGYHHFVVIKGVDGGRILLGDPAGGLRAMSQSGFEAIWLNRLLFVIHGWSGAVHFNGEADWRQTPRSPLGQAIGRDSLANITLFRPGGGDF